MKKFSDFKLAKKTLDGDKTSIDDIIGKTIVVLDYKIAPSKQKSNTEYATIQFYFANDANKEKKVLFTGSEVLKEQLEQIGESEEFEPFEATIKQIHNYYSFT